MGCSTQALRRLGTYSQSWLKGLQQAARNSHVQQHGRLSTASSSTQKEYAFEMGCSNIRYGVGVTAEVGMDCKNLGARSVCVMTDSNLVDLSPVKMTLESLNREGIPYKVYDKCRVEPTDESFKDAIRFAKEGDFDMYLAVGGGSVMDTCKAANLYATNPSADFLDYVNAPIGKGLPVTHTLKPLIAVTTTAGTGSETTATAVFDFLELKAKTGISQRALRPTLGIVDPLHLNTCPERVMAYSGIDVLCHALECYTNLSYTERDRPSNPLLRPAYQGFNPISDIWAQHALRMTTKYMKRAVYDRGDEEARSSMHLASSYAGIGFGNGGVHLCHGMCYPISSQGKKFKSKDYSQDYALIPHGLAVIITAPAVFEFTAPACPDRHIKAAECLGVDVRNVKRGDAGRVLSDKLREIMHDLATPNGLTELGFQSQDVPSLVKGTMPQHRLTKLCPRPFQEEDIATLLEKSMKVF
ncbi:hydroxyacid-oxoacid transhydrogenase, mitochondrial-like isoform X1 [Haliotis rubra]|uniref:hydroxyacid-oxoacid transhydrogenase, mitochondrial-like isoform X1 n=1 Tax=Haliotis rubra TaxID=36100 RepID=UPI001EE5669C|nr:hydroxyacid-oxoacid transhydrogenase, mitochondrial-like isoform X1 [Haliotis rubra]